MVQTSAFDEKRFKRSRIGDRVFVADDGRKTRQKIGRGRATQLFVHVSYRFGAAARLSRSLIASPRPSRGTFITATRFAPEASSARKCEKRLAAASIRSPRADRLYIVPENDGAGPKARSASSGCTPSASSRSAAFGAYCEVIMPGATGAWSVAVPVT